MQSKSTESNWLSNNLSDDEKALGHLVCCEDVKLLKSAVTKFGPCITALIRGLVHDEINGVLEFFCEATYHTEEETSWVVAEVTIPNFGHRDNADDSDELHFFEIVGIVEVQLQSAISCEFRKWATGEASVLQTVLCEVSNEEFSELF